MYFSHINLKIILHNQENQNMSNYGDVYERCSMEMGYEEGKLLGDNDKLIMINQPHKLGYDEKWLIVRSKVLVQ